MKITYEGIGYLGVTMPMGNCVQGQVCTINSAGQAVVCADGGVFFGVVDHVENGMAAVQMEGFVKLSYSGTAPNHGYVGLVSDGNGGVKVDASADKRLVVAVDLVSKTVVFKL